MSWLLNLLQTRNVFVVILGLGLFGMCARTIADPDVWWHLRTGQLILQNHAVFHSDPYSFTRAGGPWTNQEWLAEVFIFVLYRSMGWGGLIVAFAAITAAAFLLLFTRCVGRPYLAALITVWGALATAPLWGVRPQMISLLMASLLLFILEKSENNPATLWSLPALTLLWVNLHAGYAAGIALLLLYLAGDFLDALRSDWREASPRLRRLGLVAAACLLVVPLNPNGTRMFWYPLATLRSPAMQNYIVEWFSPNFHLAQYLPLLLMLLSTLPAVAALRLPFRRLFLLLATTLAALHSVRHIPLFVLVAAPILTQAVQTVWEKRGPLPWAVIRRPTIAIGVINILLLAVFAAFTVRHVGSTVTHQAEIEAAFFPAAAVAFLEAQPLPRPIFNHYDWGGYLIWKLYPKYPVFIDGRADVYGDTMMKEFADTYYLRDHWKVPLERWQIRTVILPPDSALIAALRLNGGWQQVYQDPQAVILTRPQP